jgi:hypothetical protein
MIEVRPLQHGDRAQWEQLFRDYLRFYDRTAPQALYDRAWNEFMCNDRMHALAACRNGEIVGIAHFLAHANTSAGD